MAEVNLLVSFVVGWLVSSVAIWLALKVFPGRQRREDFLGAALTALVGALVYWVFHALIWIPFLSGILGFLVWLYALRRLQGVGWLGALVLAVLIYIFNTLLGLFLPRLRLGI